MDMWLYLERKKEKSRRQLAKPDWLGRMVIKPVCVCVCVCVSGAVYSY